ISRPTLISNLQSRSNPKVVTDSRRCAFADFAGFILFNAEIAELLFVSSANSALKKAAPRTCCHSHYNGSDEVHGAKKAVSRIREGRRRNPQRVTRRGGSKCRSHRGCVLRSPHEIRRDSCLSNGPEHGHPAQGAPKAVPRVPRLRRVWRRLPSFAETNRPDASTDQAPTPILFGDLCPVLRSAVSAGFEEVRARS